MVNGRHL